MDVASALSRRHQSVICLHNNISNSSRGAGLALVCKRGGELEVGLCEGNGRISGIRSSDVLITHVPANPRVDTLQAACAGYLSSFLDKGPPCLSPAFRTSRVGSPCPFVKCSAIVSIYASLRATVSRWIFTDIKTYPVFLDYFSILGPTSSTDKSTCVSSRSPEIRERPYSPCEPTGEQNRL